MTSRETQRIRIYRKGNGCVLVDPGLALLKSGETFVLVNGTTEDAEVTFDGAAFQPIALKATRVANNYAGVRYALDSAVTIPKQSPAEFKPVGKPPYYFEYEVMLTATRDCAEGNSKPGGFVDP